MTATAQRTLGIGAAAAIILLLLSVLLLRWLLHREIMEQKLERGRRLASLGEMSAVLAHEIRNPLAALKGHAQLLGEALPSDSKHQSNVKRVVHGAIRLEKLTNDLLQFVKTGEIHRRICDPAALLRDAARSVHETRVKVDISHAPESWSLDADRMQQVLVNLIENALQASPEDKHAEVAVERRDGSLLFSVRDYGKGLEKGAENRIFEPFVTTRTQGTGLGLAIAQRLVELHGGTIEARNQPGGGAQFLISVPEA